MFFFSVAVNERLGCHVLEMPYIGEEDNGISMVVFLPPFATNALENMLERLTPEAIQESLEEGLVREVEVKFPKFSFEKSYELVPVSIRREIIVLLCHAQLPMPNVMVIFLSPFRFSTKWA